MAYVERRISFDYERDRDIIEYLDSMTSHQANKLIRQLVRDYIKDSKKSQLDRMEEKINAIARKLQNGIPTAEPQHNFSSISDDRLTTIENNINNIAV